MLDVWVEKLGFTACGSLSQEELNKLENKIKQEEERINKKKKQKVRDIQELRSHEKCFTCWEKEAEIGVRKILKQRSDNAVRWSTVVEEVGPEDIRVHTRIHTPGIRRKNSEDSRKHSTTTLMHTEMHTLSCTQASVSFSHRAEGSSPGHACLPSLKTTAVQPCAYSQAAVLRQAAGR